ncbi:lipopolysaccharide heptosyltransferase II [Dongshaea marina]|uniref:lipopolysaccharide heptosyltransferase II n=1 Tax=Dongshaea marina TaxID=2047966 RepID=UPI000D3EAF2F|nr:lipopolysaccharide heptosyltransferase II [Dongshaea marina]
MKILVIAPSWIGDMVMSQSLYKTIKQQHGCELHVMAPKWCLPLLSRMPEIDTAIEMPLGHGEFKLRTRYRLGKSLRVESYDRAYILPNSLKSALIPLVAKIPLRTGWKGESRYGLLNDLRSNKQDFPLMVQRYVALAYSREQMQSSANLPDFPHPELKIDPENQQALLEKLKLTAKKSILGLCPGAEFGPAKRWPAEYYARVAEHHIEQGGQVWLFGSQKDSEAAQSICNRLPEELQQYSHNLAGRTQLVDAIDLISLCSAVVCNDSGLMHVAAALQRPLIALYGSSSPGYTPPLAQRIEILHTDIECRPCFKRECPLGHLKCLKELSPDRVIKALTELAAE